MHDEILHTSEGCTASRTIDLLQGELEQTAVDADRQDAAQWKLAAHKATVANHVVDAHRTKLRYYPRVSRMKGRYGSVRHFRKAWERLKRLDSMARLPGDRADLPVCAKNRWRICLAVRTPLICWFLGTPLMTVVGALSFCRRAGRGRLHSNSAANGHSAKRYRIADGIYGNFASYTPLPKTHELSNLHFWQWRARLNWLVGPFLLPVALPGNWDAKPLASLTQTAIGDTKLLCEFEHGNTPYAVV